jgi:hypothetical protein
MKNKWLALLLLLLPAAAAQDPVIPKRDNLYVEFITDCNWFIYGLEGKFKLHPQHYNKVGFRAWTPYISLRDVDMRGFVIWRNVYWKSDIRDCVIFPWSSLKITYPFEPGTMPKWDFVVHYNELNGAGVPNAETHMRVWGPCEVVRLLHGEAVIKHGDKTFYVKVDENDYVNYPPWEVTLR